VDGRELHGHILVADTDAPAAEALASALQRERFATARVDTADAALDVVRRTSFDLIILEPMPPGRSGFDLLRALRAATSARIIVVTGLDAELDRVLGLELGADDYVTKPFSIAELVSRVRAQFRRRDLDRPSRAAVHDVAGIQLDVTRHEVRVDGRLAPMTRSQFKTLALLASEPGRVFTRRQIMQHLWEGGGDGDAQHACEGQISSLRRIVERDPAKPERVVTVRGVGYKLNAS